VNAMSSELDDGRTDGVHLAHSAVADSDALVDGVLAIARRETLVLAAALQASDDDSVVLATARLRWSLACAQQFAARTLAGLARARPRLAAVIEAAERWLPTEGRLSLSPERLQRFCAELSQPSLRLGTIDASDTLLIAFNLDELPLAGTVLRAATVAHVSARRARLDMTNLTAARIVRSCFEAASLRLSAFDEATLEHCDLSRANLEGTMWRNTVVSRCVMAGAVFVDARLDGPRFIECDLRGAGFQVHTAAAANAAAPAQFRRCDLRGTNWSGRTAAAVSFVDCRGPE
jgi:uncharacterized protein YjbI with pentapeptide repeats